MLLQKMSWTVLQICGNRGRNRGRGKKRDRERKTEREAERRCGEATEF
jgi:hypothetical protein